MHQRCTLLLLTLVLTAPDADDAGMIFGGKEAVPHSRPYMVLVERTMPNEQIKYCGGFLLSQNFVMTAAHCDASGYKVILGLHNFREQVKTKTVPVKQIFVSKDYDPEYLRNDLLLLKLDYNAELSSDVETILVAGPEDADPHVCSVAGWGKSEKSSHMTKVLMEVNITLSTEKENEYFYYALGHRGIGGGDSGGPLVCENGKAYGLASATIGPTEHVFSKIPKHKEWIDSIINTL